MIPPLRVSVLRQLHTGGIDPADPDWRAYGPRDWSNAMGWLDLGGLAVYFTRSLRSSGTLGALPEEVRKGLEKREEDNRSRTTAILEELEQLVATLEAARIAYALLKGPALVPEYCPEPALRTQYDHDFLVESEQVELVGRLLREAGYRRKGSDRGPVVVYRRSDGALRFPTTADGLYSPLLSRPVELHRALWEGDADKIHLALPGDFLARSQERCIGGGTFRALSDEDCFLFQILHAFRHILRNWCRVSVFLELAHFLNHRAGDEDFWTRFADRARSVRWAPEAGFVVLTLTEKLFGARIAPYLRSALKTCNSPALDLWVDRYGLRMAAANFHLDKSTLFLHREFVDNASDWSEIQRRRLVPMHRPHRPPAVVFQRGSSAVGRSWMEGMHAMKRLRFHSVAAARYLLEYPQWVALRRIRLARTPRSE